MLDDRLEGKDLEWALDHVKGCDVCRDRIEEFREIVVRVDRLPLAPIPPAVLRDAYTWAIPEGLRTDPDLAFGSPGSAPPVAQSRPEPARIEVSRWEPPISQEVTPPVRSASLVEEERPPAIVPPLPPPLFPREQPTAPPVHEVAFDSRQPAPAPIRDEFDSRRPAPSPVRNEFDSRRPPPPLVTDESATAEPPPLSAEARREERISNVTRISVGLVAAACVILAGALYTDNGLLSAFRGKPAPSHRASASARSSTPASPAASRAASPSPSATPQPTPSAVGTAIATLGDGVGGGQVTGIRLGTQDPRFSRLVFDMNAQGLPTMTITQPDAQHLVVTFKDTTGAGTPTGGIHTARVAGLEPPTQQGNDLVFTVDLARAVQVKASTRTPSDGPPPKYRLVLDLY